MTNVSTLAKAAPHSLPACANARLALFAIRRLGAHGLADAHAAHIFVMEFGSGFRRPLMVTRAFMLDLASLSAAPIAIAPCCCGRVTPAEQALLTVLARVEPVPDHARLLLADLLGIRRPDTALASAAAVATAFADAGRPIAI